MLPNAPLFALLGVLTCAHFAFAQRPVVSSVVNAASYYGGPSGGANAVAHGSMASVFGSNLANTTAQAPGGPLPTTLGGTSVTVGGVAAPLFYVSPTQLNIQMPASDPSNYTGPLVVTTASGSSDPATLGGFGGFGIFTLDMGGCGRAAIQNVANDGAVSLNSPSNSVSPGEYITIFGTGLSDSYCKGSQACYGYPPDGSPAPATPLYYDPTPGVVEFDRPDPAVRLYGGLAPTPSFAGRAPGFIGLDQINVQVPIGVREGCAVPIIVAGGEGYNSQPVPVSIHTGGGSCVDPPAAGYGQLIFERRISSGTAADGEADTLTATFPSSPGMQAPAPAPAYDLYYTAYGPFCSIPGYRSLDAGIIAAAGPFGSIQAVQKSANGQTVYQAALPSGAIQAGSFSVSASGGADVNPFQASLQIGSPIQVTSSFPPGKVLSAFSPVTVTWTGGDANTLVTVTMISHSAVDDTVWTQRVPGTDGSLTIPIDPGTTQLPVLASAPDLEIVVEAGPDPSKTTAISAPGLSLGGQLTWKYSYHFAGLGDLP